MMERCEERYPGGGVCENEVVDHDIHYLDGGSTWWVRQRFVELDEGLKQKLAGAESWESPQKESRKESRKKKSRGPSRKTRENSRRCRATTKKGKPCPIGARESGLCHVHDPEGKFQQQLKGRK